jgi:hypothetical protein
MFYNSSKSLKYYRVVSFVVNPHRLKCTLFNLATDLSKSFIEFIAFNSNIKPIKIKLKTQMGQNRYYADAVDSESDTDQKYVYLFVN